MEPEQDVFREYHREGRRKRLKGLAVFGAVALVVVIGVSVIASYTAIRSEDAEAAPRPLTGLTVATFSSVLASARVGTTSMHVGLTMTTDGRTATATGDMSVGSDPSDLTADLVVTTPELSGVEARFVGDMMYLNMGEASQNKFVAFDLGDPSGPLGGTFTRLTTGAEPLAALAATAGAIVSVEPAGPAITLDGVEAVPYAVVVDTAGVAERVGLDPATAPPQLTYQYWVGPDSLVRKMAFDTGTTSVIATFSRWGVPVTIDPPAADQIVPIPVIS
jgi:lipoprotein LprG